ncbi:hypothetical protein HPP92_003260 [Vanilla planifolia]|uniref:Uncharacterized protein n=1 Tax=Vanilla planifolia TaxID=51239 RepID=A0A835S5W3_VANPL|nr:hypothetical protein HPP92_003260 [Vanilla planifolia]
MHHVHNFKVVKVLEGMITKLLIGFDVVEDSSMHWATVAGMLYVLEPDRQPT